MRVLVTGSSGHLGEALVRTLRGAGQEAVGLDVIPSPFTSIVGSIADRAEVKRGMQGVDAVLHAATLHKPHVATHSRQAFVDTNVTGTLNLLEEATAAGVAAFVFTSTTSAFGAALTPPAGAPAVWVTEDVKPVPRNIYGTTKVAAEDLCELFHRDHGLACLILRTSRFFPEEDDRAETREAYDQDNVRANEYLYRRVDLEGPATRRNTPAAVGECSPRSKGCTSTSAPERRWAGSPATTSAMCSSASRPGPTRAARSPAPWDQRGTTCASSPRDRTPPAGFHSDR